jgi:hypothetical protein
MVSSLKMILGSVEAEVLDPVRQMMSRRVLEETQAKAMRNR